MAYLELMLVLTAEQAKKRGTVIPSTAIEVNCDSCGVKAWLPIHVKDVKGKKCCADCWNKIAVSHLKAGGVVEYQGRPDKKHRE